jgi:hypothetical protein
VNQLKPSERRFRNTASHLNAVSHLAISHLAISHLAISHLAISHFFLLTVF